MLVYIKYEVVKHLNDAMKEFLKKLNDVGVNIEKLTIGLFLLAEKKK